MVMLFVGTVLPVAIAVAALLLLALSRRRPAPAPWSGVLTLLAVLLALAVLVTALITDSGFPGTLAALGALLAALAIRLGLTMGDGPAPPPVPVQQQALGDMDELRKTIMLFSVFNSMKEMVLVVNRGGMVVFMNQAAVDRIGDQMGMSCEAVLRCGGDACRLCSVRNPDEDREAPELSELILEGRQYEVTRNRMRNDEDGRVIITARDTTERRMVERQLLLNEKMMSLGQLVAGVAHEINNPITFVFTNLELLTMMHGAANDYIGKLEQLLAGVEELGSPQLKGMVENVRQYADLSNAREHLSQLPLLVADLTEGVERVRKIVKDLKEFSHPGASEPESMDINAIIEQTLRVAHNELKQRVRVLPRLTEGLPPLFGFPQQIKQALLNLVVNSAQAMENCPPGQAELGMSTDFDGDRFTLVVSDTGKGIPPEHLPHIFDPFFTSKEVGKGTGLGLAVVYGIVERHGGEIRVQSTPGKGTAFTIVLPRQMPPASGKGTPGTSIYSRSG